MRTSVAVICLVLVLQGHTGIVDAGYSALYGRNGELWNARGALNDFSYSGYGANEDPIPSELELPNVADVTDFGAKGDGEHDDTEAIRRAIEKAASGKGGAVYFPKGTYKITEKIIVDNSRVVLRGEDRDNTIFYFPYSLADVYQPRSFLDSHDGVTKSAYSYDHGFIEFRGRWTRQDLAMVTADAARGDTRLYVGNTEYIEEGRWITIIMSEIDQGTTGRGSLALYLYAAKNDYDMTGLREIEDGIRFSSRVRKVGKDYIELERPLVHNVKVEYAARVAYTASTTEVVGIENMTLMFKWEKAAEHQQERGFNAIYALMVRNFWARNLRFLNCDSGLLLSYVDYVTATDMIHATTADRGEKQGHHAISIENSRSVDVSNTTIKGSWYHDITVTWWSFDCVIRDSQGTDLAVDLHKAAPHGNLFQNLNIGRGYNAFNIEAGRDDRGYNSAANNTFWNWVSDDGAPRTAPCNYGPNMLYVGQWEAKDCPGMGDYIEQVAAPMEPANLFEHMVLTRRARLFGAPFPPLNSTTTAPKEAVVVEQDPQLEGLTPLEAVYIQQLNATDGEYMAIDSESGNITLSKDGTFWKAYQGEIEGQILFTSNKKWLGANGVCTGLATRQEWKPYLSYFRLSLVPDDDKKNQFVLVVQCEGIDRFVMPDLSLSTIRQGSAKWMLEKP